jgi:hypothetical protein
MNPYPVITSWPTRLGRFAVLDHRMSASVNMMTVTEVIISTFSNPFMVVITAGSCVTAELRDELDRQK